MDEVISGQRDLLNIVDDYATRETQWWDRTDKGNVAEFGGEFFKTIAQRELKKLPLFADAEDDFIHKLASRAICEEHPADTEVFAINTPSDSICFILSGTFLVVGETGTVHAQMESGSFFGEVGVLLNMARTASIVSGKTGGKLFKLMKDQLNEVAREYPKFWNSIQAAAEERYALIKERQKLAEEAKAAEAAEAAAEAEAANATTPVAGGPNLGDALNTEQGETVAKMPKTPVLKRAKDSFDALDLEFSQQSLAKLPVFQGLDSAWLNRLALLLERRSFKKGDTIIQCGDDADSMFFLAAGDVVVLSE
ncbi:hypothetical protein HK405_001872, partial [Cladochytrium tenue]